MHKIVDEVLQRIVGGTGGKGTCGCSCACKTKNDSSTSQLGDYIRVSAHIEEGKR